MWMERQENNYMRVATSNTAFVRPVIVVSTAEISGAWADGWELIEGECSTYFLLSSFIICSMVSFAVCTEVVQYIYNLNVA